jgi:hypothetical protein
MPYLSFQRTQHVILRAAKPPVRILYCIALGNPLPPAKHSKIPTAADAALG